MKTSEVFTRIKTILFPENSPRVIQTSIEEILNVYPGITCKGYSSVPSALKMGEFYISTGKTGRHPQIPDAGKDEYIYFRIDEKACGILYASYPNFLYSFVCYLIEHLSDQDIEVFSPGRFIYPTFKWNRVSYDYFLTQEGRIQKNLDRGSYVKELARLGFTHIEINGLASPMGLETGPQGETYPMFYTYCPALDQFVFSRLNKSIYPDDYLTANLNYLKENARLARNYGLVPGLLCFEPRSVPEKIFEKYPMLRGARVDHPFRSFKPRYNLTITHPMVLEHYSEMLKKIMKEVPELGFLAIWTNDSGAGFEHTKSLYVGRNGGAYLIREWKDDEEIAKVAGENALRFFRVLRDTGSEINPDFRVITRLESFYGEHESIWKGLGKGLEVETTSLFAKGWEMPYTHPKYTDSNAINGGTIYQLDFDKKETVRLDELNLKDSQAHYYFSAGPHSMFEPLLGIPYPVLTYERLKLLHSNKIEHLAQSGGAFPSGLVPFNINHEVLRAYQFNPDLDIQKFIEKLALKWAGEELLHKLLSAWKLTEEAIMAFPIITPLYATFGFTWYRLWIRPLVPDIEAIPQQDRDYYEKFMCTTPHNPNNVDLSRDVLFQLTTPEKSRKDVERMDLFVWKPLDRAIQLLSENTEEKNVIRDQLIRLKALRCWFMTQRNVAAWIAGVYGYMEATNEKSRKKEKEFILCMIEKEIRNSHELIDLLESGIEFMAMTDIGETQLVYGDNLKDLLLKRIQLMEKHKNDEPYIDHNYMERKAVELIH